MGVSFFSFLIAGVLCTYSDDVTSDMYVARINPLQLIELLHSMCDFCDYSYSVVCVSYSTYPVCVQSYTHTHTDHLPIFLYKHSPHTEEGSL